EGDEHLQQHDADGRQVDLARQQRVAGDDDGGGGAHAAPPVSMRMSVTGWVASMRRFTATSGWLVCTAAVPRSTVASVTISTSTPPRGDLTRRVWPSTTPRRSKSYGLTRRTVPGVSPASDGDAWVSVPRS